MDPKYWGPIMWKIMHSYACCYDKFFMFSMHNPQAASQVFEVSKRGFAFYSTLCELLPCTTCSVSFTKMLHEPPVMAIESLKTAFKEGKLTKWVYEMHSNVNKKIGVETSVSLKNVKVRYAIRPVSFSADDVYDLLFMFFITCVDENGKRFAPTEFIARFLPILKLCVQFGDPLSTIRSDPLFMLYRDLSTMKQYTIHYLAQLWKLTKMSPYSIKAIISDRVRIYGKKHASSQVVDA